jgi:hypothetical protein
MACTGIHDRANRRKQIASPLGAKPIRDLPEHRAQANGLLAGVVRGWNGGVIQKQAQVVANLGLALWQAFPMRVGRLVSSTPVDTPLEITTVLIPCRGSQGVPAFVHHKRPQQYDLHARGQYGIPGLERTLAIPPLMGQTDLPVRGRVMLLGTVEIGDPDGWSMVAQDVSDDPVATAGTNDMHTDLGMLKDPFPLGASVDPCPGFIPADQAAAAQAGQHLRHPVVQPGVHPLDEMGQRPLTDGHPTHLREEGRQPRVADGVRIPQVSRQPLDRGPKRRAGLQPHRNRGHIRLSTVGTRPGILLHPGHDRPDRWQLHLVIHRMRVWLVRLHCALTMRTGLGWSDDDLVGLRMPWPTPASTSDTGLATSPRAWTGRMVRLRRLRGRNTRVVGVLARLMRFGFECRKPGFQQLYLCPQRVEVKKFSDGG